MPRGEAIVAVLRRGDRLLAIRRGPGVVRPGYWQPLSGKIEPGESQREAVVREIREEVGLSAAPLAKVWESETDDGTFRLHWWTADAPDGQVVPDPHEVGDFRWVTPEEFLALDPVFDGDREFFERVLPNLEP
ncbi:NUDIX domain-containing protein [Streptomyces sp. NPDC058954]|uniref:NUDIX domain-containing protein n=1 Tax=Streptomyces sp. NPDC058954 TaxID=3346677 RepID=UPI003694FBE2